MNDKKDIKKDEALEVESAKKPKKVKVKVLANIKYGEEIHTVGEKIYILASEVKEFRALKLVEKLVFEKEELEPEEGE